MPGIKREETGVVPLLLAGGSIRAGFSWLIAVGAGGGALTIGYFDGVHRGHLALLAHLRKRVACR